MRTELMTEDQYDLAVLAEGALEPFGGRKRAAMEHQFYDAKAALRKEFKRYGYRGNNAAIFELMPQALAIYADGVTVRI